MTKYLTSKPSTESHKANPYTIEEMDAHENSSRIWATVTAIKVEAQEAVRGAYDNGYRDGLYDRESKGS